MAQENHAAQADWWFAETSEGVITLNDLNVATRDAQVLSHLLVPEEFELPDVDAASLSGSTHPFTQVSIWRCTKVYAGV